MLQAHPGEDYLAEALLIRVQGHPEAACSAGTLLNRVQVHPAEAMAARLAKDTATLLRLASLVMGRLPDPAMAEAPGKADIRRLRAAIRVIRKDKAATASPVMAKRQGMAKVMVTGIASMATISMDVRTKRKKRCSTFSAICSINGCGPYSHTSNSACGIGGFTMR